MNAFNRRSASETFLSTGQFTDADWVDVRLDLADLLITDLLMPNMEGNELIEKAHEIQPNLIPIVITAHATIETAIKALQQGAYDYITKPFKSAMVIETIEKLLI